MNPAPKIDKEITRLRPVLWDFGGQVEILKTGGVGVLPTDTLYGLVSSALSKKAVERIYKLKKRDPKKPMIVLIADLKALSLFNVKIDASVKKILQKFWPGKVSIILPCADKKFSYLHRDTRTLAFRLSALNWLRDLLKKTGPLVAPSANPENMPPAKTIQEAKEYFCKNVDFYVDGGKLARAPSTLIEIKDNRIIIKRKGAVKIRIRRKIKDSILIRNTIISVHPHT